MSALMTDLKAFLAASPTPYHAVEQMALRLREQGFQFLPETDDWNLQPAGRYFSTRNASSIVAWVMPADNTLQESGLRMVGAHTDSPCLKVKPQPDLHRQGYNQLGVEVYGGALLNPWFDRDLSFAGRVSYLNAEGTLQQGLVNFIRPLAVIPSLAIHLDREANKNRSVNAQTSLPVIVGQSEDKLDFKAMLLEQLKQEGDTDAVEVLDYEISLYDVQPPALTGLNEEFLSSARLDNLLSCYLGLRSLLDSNTDQGALLICNDHEEVGSVSASGAQGPMLTQLIERLLPDPQARVQMISRSMMISVDNAHGIHPNFADKHDANHGPLLNGGPVIKANANQRYATNSETGALFRHLAKQEGVPVQSFVVRSDMACGSTIGPITAAELGVKTLDVGAPQFAMHSIREMSGVADTEFMVKILKRFFSTEQV